MTLTGTDLYRDVPQGDIDALASIEAADRIVVLQEDALRSLPAQHRAKADVVYQSAPSLPRFARKPTARLSCVFVGHLRPEKDPVTLLRAWQALGPDAPIFLSIIGGGLDEALAGEVRRAAAADARIRWLGALSHGRTRQAIRRAHVLICASRMEGGANVVVEAVTSGTAVVASRISGNVGMLGRDHAGLFDLGDAQALAALLERCLAEPAFVERLECQGAARAPLFTPDAERSALRSVVESAFASRREASSRATPQRIA